MTDAAIIADNLGASETLLSVHCRNLLLQKLRSGIYPCKLELSFAIQSAPSVPTIPVALAAQLDFNIGDIAPEISDDIVFFENVPAVIYPHGNYRAVVIQGED